MKTIQTPSVLLLIIGKKCDQKTIEFQMLPQTIFFSIKINRPFFVNFKNSISIGVNMPGCMEGQADNMAKTGKRSISMSFEGNFPICP